MLENSNCNEKASVLRSDSVKLSDKSRLPVTKLNYGPLKFESDKMEIVVGPLMCKKEDSEWRSKPYQTIENQFEELHIKIDDLTLGIYLTLVF